MVFKKRTLLSDQKRSLKVNKACKSLKIIHCCSETKNYPFLVYTNTPTHTHTHTYNMNIYIYSCRRHAFKMKSYRIFRYSTNTIMTICDDKKVITMSPRVAVDHSIECIISHSNTMHV